jgi:hypothetical protein
MADWCDHNINCRIPYKVRIFLADFALVASQEVVCSPESVNIFIIMNDFVSLEYT